MRAALLANSRIDVRTVQRPEPGAGQVRVAIEACGLCGSDLHFFHQGTPLPGGTPGHEVVGRVDALGNGVTRVSEGTRVVVEPIESCGECRRCFEGRGNLCRAFQIHGVTLPGGFAEAIVVPETRAFAIAEDVDSPVAAMSEPVAVCLHGLDQGALAAGERVLIVGAGSIGLVGILCARALGAGEIWVTARYESQAELARELGATRVLAEDEASTAEMAKLATRVDFDLVLETVGGHANTLEVASAAVRPGGRISVLGLFQQTIALEPFPLLMKETTLTWSNCYAHPSGQSPDFERAARLVERERDRLALLTTHQLPLEQAARAYELAGDKRSGAIKVTITP